MGKLESRSPLGNQAGKKTLATETRTDSNENDPCMVNRTCMGLHSPQKKPQQPRKKGESS